MCVGFADGYIRLRVTPQYIEQSGNWVTVKWSGVNNPSDADWIGVYSPPNDNSYPIDPVNHAPIKYQVFIPTRCVGWFALVLKLKCVQ